MPSGGWYGLLDTLKQQDAEAQYYKTQPPTACPNDGTLLTEGPPNRPGILFCPFGCGFEYPRDWDPDTMGGL